MSALRKLTALIICIIMLCACFVSCDQIPGNNQGNNQGGDQNVDDSNNQSGDQSGNQNNQGGNQSGNQSGNQGDKDDEDVVLQSDYYAATVQIKYFTDDDKMKATIESMGTPETSLAVMGKDIRLITSASVNGTSTYSEYIYLNGILYHNNIITVGDKSISSFKKAEMSDSKRDILLSKAGAGANIDISDFVKCDMSRSGKTVIFNCSELNNDAKKSLEAIMSSKFESVSATVKLNDASFVLYVENDRNESSVLSCDFVITMNGESYKITMELSCSYNYNAPLSMTSPTDVDKYTLVPVEDILG